MRIVGKTGEDAADVAIHRRHRNSEGDGSDRCRRVISNAREAPERIGMARNLSTVFRDDFPYRTVQISSSSVIPEPRPEREDVLGFGRRECLGIGESLHPSLEVGKSGIDPRLLEHEFGNEDAVRIRRVPPR
jgi:hypothetical protein